MVWMVWDEEGAVGVRTEEVVGEEGRVEFMEERRAAETAAAARSLGESGGAGEERDAVEDARVWRMSPIWGSELY